MRHQPEIMFGVYMPYRQPTEVERQQVMKFIANQAEQKRQKRQAYIEQLDRDIAHLKQQLRRGDK